MYTNYQVDQALLCLRSELNDTRDLLPRADLQTLEEKTHLCTQLQMFARTGDELLCDKIARHHLANELMDLVERMPAAPQSQEESLASLQAAARALIDESKALTGTLRDKREAAVRALTYAQDHGTALDVEVAQKEVNRLNSLRRRVK